MLGLVTFTAITAITAAANFTATNMPRFDCHPDRPELTEQEFQELQDRLTSKQESKNSESEIDDNSDWELGTASAYGGYGDAPIPNNQITATGDAVTEYSYGVAVPMCWNTRENLGKTILIRYNGITVEGIINDVGGMGNGTRTLDLQPGILKEFGADNCNDWGLRTVEYKIL